MEQQDLAELSLFDLERLLAIKRYFLSSAATPEDLLRLQREVDAIETRIVLKKVDMGVHSGDEDEKEEAFYNEDEGHDSDSNERANNYVHSVRLTVNRFIFPQYLSQFPSKSLIPSKVT